jgi:hypothetical protein
VSVIEIIILAGVAVLLLVTAVVLDRLIASVAAAIASVFDLIHAVVVLVLALIRFSVRVRRLVLRSIVAPLFGAPR